MKDKDTQLIWESYLAEDTGDDIKKGFETMSSGFTPAMIRRAFALMSIQGRYDEGWSILSPKIKLDKLEVIRKWTENFPKYEGATTSQIHDNPEWEKWSLDALKKLEPHLK